MNVLRLALALVVVLAASCGSDSGPGGGAQCSGDEDCPGGLCVDGQCTSFGGFDAVADDTGSGHDKDSETGDLGRVDQSGDPDLVGDSTEPQPDSFDPPDVHQEDTGNVKPPVGGDPNIMVDPVQYSFTYLPGVVNPQSTIVNIYNQGGGTLTVKKVSWKAGSSSEFTISGMPTPNKKVEQFGFVPVMVAFQEKAPHGPATLVIESDDPDQPVVEVAFTSASKTDAAQCIQISPGVLAFGSVERGQSKTLSFSIINCSDKLPLTVTQIKRTAFFGMTLSDEFQMTPTEPGLPLVIQPNQKHTQALTYSPGLAGYDSGDFVFVNNDPTNTQAKLSVSGMGVPPPLEKIGLHIELEWDTDSTDVDLHLLAPNGTFFDCTTDCYFSNMNPDWGTLNTYIDDPFLDYDDVDGYGPEHINVEEPVAGTYKVLLHYYADNHDGSSSSASNATVRIYSYGQLLKTFGPTNLAHTNINWDVCTISWPSASITTLGDVYDIGSTPSSGCLPWL